MSTGPGPFERVYDAHVVAIYRFIYARVGNHPDAEDLTAQVFVRAVEQLDTSRDPGQIAAWLYRVAQNATADYWRAFYRLPLVGVDHVAPGWEPADESGNVEEPDERAGVAGPGAAAPAARPLPPRARAALPRAPERGRDGDARWASPAATPACSSTARCAEPR